MTNKSQTPLYGDNVIARLPQNPVQERLSAGNYKIQETCIS